MRHACSAARWLKHCRTHPRESPRRDRGKHSTRRRSARLDGLTCGRARAERCEGACKGIVWVCAWAGRPARETVTSVRAMSVAAGKPWRSPDAQRPNRHGSSTACSQDTAIDADSPETPKPATRCMARTGHQDRGAPELVLRLRPWRTKTGKSPRCAQLTPRKATPTRTLPFCPRSSWSGILCPRLRSNGLEHGA